MNDPSLFNPLPLPPSLNLAEEPETTTVHQQAQNPAQTKGPSQTKARRSSGRKRRRRAATATAAKPDDQTRWERIKGRIAAKLSTVGQDRLKQVLLACGVTATVLAAVLLAVKLMPAALTLLALLGLGLAIQLWDRLRWHPYPF